MYHHIDFMTNFGFVYILDISLYGEIRQRTFSRRHFIKEPSCSFEGDVTTEY